MVPGVPQPSARHTSDLFPGTSATRCSVSLMGCSSSRIKELGRDPPLGAIGRPSLYALLRHSDEEVG
jgi:hypothetical protein